MTYDFFFIQVPETKLKNPLIETLPKKLNFTRARQPSELLEDHQNVNQMNQLLLQKKSMPIPVTNIRYDGVHHRPKFCKKKVNCRLCKTGNSQVYCKRCNIWLCISNTKDWFYDINIYHVTYMTLYITYITYIYIHIYII